MKMTDGQIVAFCDDLRRQLGRDTVEDVSITIRRGVKRVDGPADDWCQYAPDERVSVSIDINGGVADGEEFTGA